ncbi:hypothetical protein [Lysobacter sp. CA199]|uniref:hypothetical protein n=1 Tax=Lysobacter sp. CA199 TaxID=3455608 RepID=UPI003F8D541D
MKSCVHYAVCAALCLASASSIAGMEKESQSTRPDLFFAWLSPADQAEPVSVYFDKRANSHRLTEHCKSGLPVYKFQQNTRYTCKADWYPLDSSDPFHAVGVTVKGPIPKSDTHQFGMFSLKPTRTTRWNTRAIMPDEQAALKAVIDTDKPRLRLPRKQLKLASATAVSVSDKGRTTIVVPGNVVQDVAGYYHAQRHYVFVNENGRYAYQGMIPAKPTKYFDLDGDDLPDMLVEESCDGLCISLWSISKGVRKVAEFGGH